MSNLSVSKKPNKLLVFYQGILAVAAVLIFFTKFDIFLEQWGIGIPLYWLFGFLILSAPLSISFFGKIEYIPKPLLIWCMVYFGMSCLATIIAPKIPDMQLLEDQIRSILFLGLTVVLFSEHAIVQKAVKIAILIVSFFNIGCFIYEFFNPLTFGALNAYGRAAGFYIDSNEAGCALVLGMIFCIDLFKPQFRLLFAFIIMLGIMPTLSRGAILTWGLVIIFFMIKKIIPTYQISFLGLAIASFFIVLITQINNLDKLKAADGTPLFNDDTLTRVEFLVDPFSEDQDTSRISLVEDAWQSFAEQPFLGKGLGKAANNKYMSPLGEPQLPHNTYLTLMIEYGFLGFFLYPGLILATIWKAQGHLRNLGIAFTVLLLFWGIFSHTTLTSYFILMSISYMAILVYQNRMNLNINKL
ncbi:MAG: hypothetical protein Tsb0014_11490 [Pleurocapsa sp.]